MGWFRVLIETWWWVLLGALVGLVVGYYLGRLLKPRDVLEHPHFRALKAEFDEQRTTRDAQAAQVEDLERAVAAQRAETAKARAALDVSESERRALAAVAPAETAAPPFDATAAAAEYGGKVVLDDLKIVEGIGPKIEELLHGAGIRTWRELATAPSDTVRDVLKAGGDRFRIHDPATWAEQARLAAAGAFAELKAYQDQLTAGRS